MKWLENCRLKCSFWWWWKDLIKINSREPLCCAYWEDEGSLILLPWCCAWGGGLPRCRALHFDEAKRVRDVSLMTQTQTSWRMHYRQHAARRDASNTGKTPRPIISCPRYRHLNTKARGIYWQTLNGKTKNWSVRIYSDVILQSWSKMRVKYSEEEWMELLK